MTGVPNLTVAGVNTLISRAKSLVQWANTIRVWMIDECHHVLADNQWGKAVLMFNRARGIWVYRQSDTV